MEVGALARLTDGDAGRLGPALKICDDRLLVHAMLDISIPAKRQEHKCKEQMISVDANDARMADLTPDLAADTKLINDLCEYAGKKPSVIAKDIGVAVTTLTRPANGKATTKLGRKTISLLAEAYPDFPGWGGGMVAKSEPAPAPNARVLPFEGDGLDNPEENLPVWGSGLGAARMFDGEAVEQTDLNTGSELEYVRRPAILKGKRGAYALHVQGSSMHPALPDGELVVACRDMPLSMGDNVVVYLRHDEIDDGASARGVLVKELVRRSASYIELRQYDPPIVFRVETVDVLRVDRILTRREMVS